LIMAEGKKHVGVVIVGHVDAGKSTTTGRLLFELGGLDERTLKKLEDEAKAEGKESFKFAFFMDKSKEERKRGVTIACTTKEFFTDEYHYTIIDAPGHKDFIKNMISGASQADVALLMVPANKGGFETAIQKGGNGAVKGQTRHHAELCNLLGISQIMVGVNKMDEQSCKYSQDRYNEIASEMRNMLKQTGWKTYKTCPVIPISGWAGDNIVAKSANMPWWKGYDDAGKQGSTLKEAFSTWVQPPERAVGLKFRMPVSGVYKIKGVGDVITGRIEQGELEPSMKVKTQTKPTEIVFWPSGVQARVNTIEMHHKNVPLANQGDNVGVACKGLVKDNMPKVGDVMTIAGDDTIFAVETFTADVKIQDHPGELKPGDEKKGGYTPLVLCRTAKSACRMVKINWKVTKKAMKKVKSKKDLEKAKEVEPPHVKAGDMASIVFQPQQPFCVTDFKNCPGLGRIAVLESNSLVMLGKISAVTKKIVK